MDFENEPYVRYYRRKTTTWLLLSWQAQAILSEILVLVDRAGVFELGGLSPAEAVGLHIPKWPSDVVIAGINDILSKNILEHRGDCLVWPKYLDGQEAPQSDRARKAESRAKRRDRARNGNVTNCDPEVTKCDAVVTICDEMSRLVTRGHVRSRPVTPILSDPSEPSDPAELKNKLPAEAFPELVEKHQLGNGAIDPEVKAILEETQNFVILAEDSCSEFWKAAEKAYFSDSSPISLEGELQKADAWLLANPRRKPTQRGMKQFVRNWLERAVEIERKKVQVNGQAQKSWHRN